MRIFINARFLTQLTTGVQRYAIELIKALDNLIDSGLIDLKRYSFTLISPKSIKYELNLKHIPLIKKGYLKGHLWEQIELPIYTRKGMLISLCNAAPLFKKNQVVTIHDAAVFANPKNFSFAFRIWYKILLTGLGVTATKIITVSSFSKKELIKYCNINDAKIQVTYVGKEHVFTEEPDITIIHKQNLANKKFILAVSSMSPNKNFHSIVRAIQLLGDVDFDFVIAGGLNPKVFRESEIPFTNNVKQIGYVTDGELRALYEHASCFIFPSLYEGFGLPPLEAMACGCPVIVSEAASIPEVCGDAALYCDPYSPRDIADKILLLMSDSALREKLRRKGLERAKQFNWEKCARETVAVIEEVLSQ